MKDRKPGEVREGKIEIFDHKGRPRGHVGPKATAVTVSRFIGLHGAKLGTKNGKPAWLGPKPPSPRPPTADPTAVAVAKEQAKGATKSSPSANQTLEISLKAAKGSNSKPAPKPSGAKVKPAGAKK